MQFLSQTILERDNNDIVTQWCKGQIKGWEPFVHAYKVCAVIHFSERGIHPQLTTAQTERSNRLTFD